MSESNADRRIDAAVEARLEARAGYSPHTNRILHQSDAENAALMAAEGPSAPTYLVTRPYNPDTLRGAAVWERIICNVCRFPRQRHSVDTGECMALRRDYMPYYLGMTHETEPSGRDRRQMEDAIRSEGEPGLGQFEHVD